MSAPPGWHPQPDGRERWWDGQQWTEHFRDPVVTPPTQAYDPAPTQGGYGTEGTGYGAPSTGYGAPGTGYGSPGSAGPPPQKQGMGSTAKGCLIGAVVLIVLLIIGLVVGGIFFARTVDNAVQDAKTAFPTVLPSELPTDLPQGGGEAVVIVLGDGFELPSATIAPGWTLQDDNGIGRSVDGMTATFTTASGLPVLFTMEFQGGEQTVCTATRDGDAETGAVTCIPVFGEVADGEQVTVTPTF